MIEKKAKALAEASAAVAQQAYASQQGGAAGRRARPAAAAPPAARTTCVDAEFEEVQGQGPQELITGTHAR